MVAGGGIPAKENDVMGLNLKTWLPLGSALMLGTVAAKIGHDMMNRKPAEKTVEVRVAKVVVAKETVAGGAAIKPTDLAVMKVDEEFRLAKMRNDTSTLERIVSDHYYATNQNRNSRNKEQLIELFRTFPVSPLTTDEFHIRIVDGTAFVTGFQTESGDRMAFMRSETRIMHLRHRRMLRKTACDLPGGVLLPLHAHRECAQTSQSKPGIERCARRAATIRPPFQLLGVGFAGRHHGAADHVGVTVEILRG